jgi:hypothetical protein
VKVSGRGKEEGLCRVSLLMREDALVLTCKAQTRRIVRCFLARTGSLLFPTGLSHEVDSRLLLRTISNSLPTCQVRVILVLDTRNAGPWHRYLCRSLRSPPRRSDLVPEGTLSGIHNVQRLCTCEVAPSPKSTAADASAGTKFVPVSCLGT